MGKIKLALVGAGERGQNSYAPYAKLHGYEIEFVAVAEPIEERREKFRNSYNVPKENCFLNGDEFFSKPKMADAVMICTQDTQHFDYAVTAIKMGYKILLEKPISPDPKECLTIQKLAEEHNTEIIVCHVMRYTKFFRTIKDIIDSGKIGDVVSIVHTENVGYWHYAHSYVRGNWRNTKLSSPMILAKCCHDMDIISWLLGSRCKTVSSFGGLKYFTEKNAPEGAPQRCTDGCPESSKCPYYSPAIYLTENISFPTSVLGPDYSYESRLKQMQEGIYGRCVYRCDNDVVDHQTANLEFENGVTVAFTMCGFTNECDRIIKFMGTKGEIVASMEHNTVSYTDFGQGLMTGTTVTLDLVPNTTGHSGGDEGIMEELVLVLKGERENTNTIGQSVHSHIVSLAVEESRLTGKTVQIKDYEDKM